MIIKKLHYSQLISGRWYGYHHNDWIIKFSHIDNDTGKIYASAHNGGNKLVDYDEITKDAKSWFGNIDSNDKLTTNNFRELSSPERLIYTDDLYKPIYSIY
jgi:hypothetical protein